MIEDKKKKKRRSLEAIMMMSEEYRKELTRLTRIKADKMELQLRKEKGNTLDREETEKTWSMVIATARSQFLNLPEKLGSQLALLNNPAETTKLLRDSLDEILDELKKGEIKNEFC